MDIQASALIILPVIVGLVQVLKIAGMKSRWLPLFSVILGIIGSLVWISTDATGVLAGIVAGLASSGLWNFGKKTVMGVV